MAELCMVGYTYHGYEMRDAFERAKQFGYDSIELRDFSDIDFSSPEKLRESLENAQKVAKAHDLNIASVFYSPLPVARHRAAVHTPTAQAVEAVNQTKSFLQVIDALADHHIPILHTRLSLKQANAGAEVIAASATEEDYRLVKAALQDVIPAAEQRRVRIALETHMGTIHDTAASQLRIVSAVDSPYLVASLDFANMLIVHPQENLLETVKAFKGRIGYVHVKNLKLNPLGFDWNLPVRWGDINYYRIFTALKAAGYDGPIAVEYCGTGDPDVFAADDAAYLRDLMERVGL